MTTPNETPTQTPTQAPISAAVDPLDALLDELERRREVGARVKIALSRQSLSGRVPLPEPDPATWHPSDAARYGPGTYLVQLRGERGSYIAQATFKIEGPAAGGAGNQEYNNGRGGGGGAPGGAGAGVVGGFGSAYSSGGAAAPQASGQHGDGLSPAMMFQALLSMQQASMQQMTAILTALLSRDNAIKPEVLVQLAKGGSDVGSLVAALRDLQEMAPASEGGGRKDSDLSALASMLAPILASAAAGQSIQNTPISRSARPGASGRALQGGPGTGGAAVGGMSPTNAPPVRPGVQPTTQDAMTRGGPAPLGAAPHRAPAGTAPDLPTFAARALADIYTNGGSAWFGAATVFELSREYDATEREAWATALLDTETADVVALLVGLAPVFGASEDARLWAVSAVDRLAEMFDDEYGDNEVSDDDDEVQRPEKVQRDDHAEEGASSPATVGGHAQRGSGGDGSVGALYAGPSVAFRFDDTTDARRGDGRGTAQGERGGGADGEGLGRPTVAGGDAATGSGATATTPRAGGGAGSGAGRNHGGKRKRGGDGDGGV